MAGPDPAVAEVRSAVRRALRNLSPTAEQDPLVLVGCSGGADSLALAAATAFVAGREGWRAGAVVVDHGLSDGSAEVAARAAQQCAELGLDPVVVERVDVGLGAPGGLEGLARRARHAAFDDVVERTGAAALLLAHTADDQAETVLLRLARGSGTRSLAGIAPSRGAVLRPLLGVRRAVLRRACEAQGLTWWEDPGNAVDGPQRTSDGAALPRAAVRHRVLPALEAALGADPVAALARTADQLRLDADLLDRLAREVLARAAGETGATDEVTDEPTPSLAVAVLAAGEPALLPRVLRAWLVAAGSPAGDLGAVHLAAVAALVTDWRGQRGADVPGGLTVVRRSDRLEVTTGSRRPPPMWNAAGVSTQAWQYPEVGGDLVSIVVSEEEIRQRLAEMAARIDADYAGKEVLLVGVLKGAAMVMSDLMRQLRSDVSMDWMAVSSYGKGTQSSGVVRILKDLDTDLTGKHVLIVEDIIDSGLTLSWLIENLRSRGPASLEIATLLRKPDAAKVEVDVRYLGFDIANEFVVGYGLDYAERYRQLPFVAVLAPHVYGG